MCLNAHMLVSSADVMGGKACLEKGQVLVLRKDLVGQLDLQVPQQSSQVM